jgi:multisubunit Na+/H+ antiporter MnhF subunit
VITTAFVLLGLAGTGFLYRLFVGPSLADRIIAIDGAALIAISILCVETARTGKTVFIDAVFIVGLLGFVATSIAARFVEQRGG